MEESRESQPVAPPGSPVIPSYSNSSSLTAPYGPSVHPPTKTAVRILRLLLYRLLWYADQCWLLIRPQLGWIILTAFLLSIIGVLSVLLLLPRLFQNEPEDTRASLIQPAPAVVDFLRGQQNFDADLVWSTFSPSFQESLEARNFTREALAEQMEQERRAGQRYRTFTYIGGVKLPDAQAMYFYVVEVTSPHSLRSRTISFVFTVDRNGKIIAIE